MKPSKIFSTLDLARKIRANGEIFNPLFVGPPGVGKSQIVQQWCRARGLPFVDLRAAYLEAPDVIGFPSIETVGEGADKRQVTVHNTPEFWPHSGEGVLLLEEPNRGTTSVLNTFMQILTDRRIHNYSLPNRWIIVGCINPENGECEVNNMDAALKNRFSKFDVEYNREDFLSYMKDKMFDTSIVQFVESKLWTYKTPEEIASTPGNQYVSSRSWSKINAMIHAGVGREDEMEFFGSELGSSIAKAFYAFRNEETPVLFQDLLTDKKRSLKKLERYSDTKSTKNSLISVTVKDIVDNGQAIDNDTLVEVLEVMPVDHGVGLVKELEFARKEVKLLERLVDEYPSIKKLFKETLKYDASKKDTAKK